MSVEIRAKLSLDSSGFVKGSGDATKAVKGLGDAADAAGKTTTQSLTAAEKAASGAAKALSDYRKIKAEAAGRSRSGSEQALMALGALTPFGKAFNAGAEAEAKAYQAHLDRLAIFRQAAVDKIAKQKPLFNESSLAELDRQAPRIRYALYDIGNQALAASAALTGFGIAAVTAFAKFESAFTSVERTSGLTGAALENLRTQLIDLSTVVPVSFEDIARIATLGAQMGIAADSLGEFTKTVSEFSTITGISVEETAQAFGRLAQLMNVPVTQFENLSSAVAFAGVNAVATDREIVVMAESIAATGTQAGLSADEVVGFATALASLKVRPEEARGVLVRLFRTIDLAVSEGGTALDDFAKVINSTAADTATLWKQDPSQFVQAFLAGAKSGDQLNAVITALGITNTRELNVIQRLAGNIDVLKSSLDDAAGSYATGTYASEAYGKSLDDLQSRLTVLTNSLTALISEVGAPLGEFLKPVVVILTEIVNGVRKFSESAPLLSAIVTVLATLAGLFLAIKAGLALTIAGLLAFRTAITGLNGALGGMGISLKTAMVLTKQMTVDLLSSGNAAGGSAVKYSAFTASLVRYGVSARAATVATRALTLATGPLGWALTAIGLAASMVDWGKIANGSDQAGQAMIDAAGGADALKEAIRLDTESGAKGYAEVAIGIAALSDEQIKARRAVLQASVARLEDNKNTKAGQDAYEKAKTALKEFNDEVDRANAGVSTNTAVLGDNTAAFILNGLSKMGEDGAKNFWVELTSLPAGTQAALTALGFDAGQMVSEGLKEGGETSEQYSTRFANALSFVQVSANLAAKDLARILKEQYKIDIDAAGVEKLRKQMEETGPVAGDYRDVLIEGGKGSDVAARATIANVKAQDSLGTALKGVGADAGDTGEQVQSLAEQLRQYTNAALAAYLGSTTLNSTFANVAQSVADLNGPLTTLTEEGREGIQAWAAFMNQALEQSIANGGDFTSAIATMASGLAVLEAQGKNTTVQFQMLRDAIVQNIVKTSPILKAYASELGTATSIPDLQDKINQRILLAKADAVLFLGKGDISRYNSIMADVTNLQKIADSLGGSGSQITDFSKVYSDAMKDIDKSTAKAKTALEKLMEQINKAFKYTNLFVNVRSSLDSLGDSLRENGKSFDSFTEAGRSNIGALQGVINQLAQRSGGDVKKFANELASLRKVLADAGVPAAGLKIIDNVLKQLRTKGKASASTMKELAKALGEVSAERAPLEKIVEVTSRIAQAVQSAFAANFAYSDSIDAVTLGWEAMADAQEQAAKRIADLKQESLDAADAITEAKLAIDEANASIAELTASRSKVEYQLQIALKYGDTLRANELQAKLAEIDADVAKERNNVAEANKEIADSQQRIADINTELNRPKTATEIINENKALRDMASSYGNMTTFMLMNAEEGANLNDIIEKQVTAFKNNAIAMGYTETQANAVAAVLRDSLLGQINAVNDAKMDLGITVNTTDATDDMSQFVTDANELLKGVQPAKVKVETDKAKADVVAAVRSINAQLDNIKSRTVTVTTVYNSTGGSALGVVKRASGGLVTGPGTSTSDSIAARLSDGEYVVKASAVKYYGTDFMNALNNMSLQRGAMAGASISVAGSQTVYLSPEDRQLLRQAIDRPIALYTDNAVIAKSANDGNTILAQRGIR